MIYIDVDNVKSKFIPISLGFKKEIEISQFEFYNGSYHDFEIYGLNVNERNIANGKSEIFTNKEQSEYFNFPHCLSSCKS